MVASVHYIVQGPLTLVKDRMGLCALRRKQRADEILHFSLTTRATNQPKQLVTNRDVPLHAWKEVLPVVRQVTGNRRTVYTASRDGL